MQNLRLNVSCYLIVALLFLAPFSYAGNDTNDTSQIKRCNTSVGFNQCGKNERCFLYAKDEEAQCKCLKGYQLEGGQCVQLTTTTIASAITGQPNAKDNSGGSSVAAGLLIPTFLIVMCFLLYFVARRYKWLQRVRQLRPNHYGNVLVTRDDDDDDDPPIA
ncbi:unnamed protein product [Xylocopa violacea]|uniref:EGF-like domain-containing protein n=1 Tax=Xylocopa violacea TaxID=135666 RepID=A0ABP1NK27_XYLVO